MNKEKEAIAFPLLFARENERVFIVELKGGQNFKDKCIDQGIIPGHRITILNNNGHGPCLAAVNDARIMIGHGMLSRIYVRPA